jgi:outer membrane lipoprotein-sorting protein
VRTTTLRWTVPLGVAALISSGAAFNAAAADGVPGVPSRTLEQVLALQAGSTVSAFSGTVQTHSALGLPDLGSLKRLGGSRSSESSSPSAGLDLQGLVTRFLGGENTLRVWADGPQRQRAQLLDPFDELEVVRNGSSVSMYSSSQAVVAQGTFPQTARQPGTPLVSPDQLTPDQLTPDALARRALAWLDPTTSVALTAPSTVAGRATYSLVLTPRSSATLVDHIVINVDAGNGAVLQCRVYARGQAEVALQTGFTSIDFARPEAARFQFTPPPSARVTALPTAGDLAGLTSSRSGAEPTVHGTGWTTIEELPGDGPSALLSSGGLSQVTTPVAGGRAIRTALFSVLLLDDGRTLMGAVPVPALVAAAG